MKYIIWDKFDNVVHLGPCTAVECFRWMQRCRKIMPRSAGVDEMFVIRRVSRFPKFMSRIRK